MSGNVGFWIQLVCFAGITGYAVSLFVQAVSARIAFIKLGRSEDIRDWKPRIRYALARTFGHRTLLQDWRSGVMHLVLFYGFIAVQFGALELIVQGFARTWHWPLGPLYPAYSASQEGAVMLILLAVLYATYRRYIEKLPRLKRSWKAGVVLLLIGSLMLSVLLAQGFRDAMLVGAARDGGGQPLAGVLARAIDSAGIGASGAELGFYTAWWAHLLILLGFLVYVPQSKHAHLLFAPFNLALRRTDPPGKLSTVDIADESAEQFGVGTIERFTQNQLTDLYACVECGRCTSVCPAASTGKLLSPMQLIVNMREHLTRKGAAVTSRSPWVPAYAFAGGGTSDTDGDESLVGGAVTEEELWACTTCRSCEEQCPVGNEHVSFIVDMRRYLVMTEGSMPSEAARTLTNIERQGNPWGISRRERGSWRDGMEEGLDAPTCSTVLAQGGTFDYLLFVGSMGSYDKRSTAVTRAVVKILNKAGISFAVLGGEEGNSGDTARRLGNDYLYQQLAEENIAKFEKYGVKRIITIDPHAYNTFKHEYRELGLPEDVEVYHHTELIERWLREGRIRPAKPVSERIVYHDSCYLGRYNGSYEAPRDIIRSLPGARLLEMEQSRQKSTCCGAGGGLMWLEETEGTRINVARTEQALQTNPTVIGTACPYCLTMLGDGTKALEAEERVRTLDVAELLAMSLD